MWLDRDGHYTDFVGELAERHTSGDFPHPVVPFRGSFLEMMLALEGHAAGLDPAPLLIHMPGFTEDDMRRTPLLELYRAGTRYRRSLETLIRETASGRVEPEKLERFLASDAMTLAKADAWLARETSGGHDGLAGLLEDTSLEVVVAELLVRSTFLESHLNPASLDDLGTLRAYLGRKLGMTEAWVRFICKDDPHTGPLDGLKEALASWVLCVEYVHDLRRGPALEALKPLKSLRGGLVEICREQAELLRTQAPDRYEALADQVETHLHDELPNILPEDLGRIDTFRTEEARILDAAVQALGDGRWDAARAWAADRSARGSFWLQRDARRNIEWSLVADAATLGCGLAEQARPLQGWRSLDEAMAAYAEAGAVVDRAHRHFEQRRARLLQPQLPHFRGLKLAVAGLRARYREWADMTARDFSQLCRAQGALPAEGVQQRAVFGQVIAPLVAGAERVAVLLVDGLRYEMAQELAEALQAEGATVELSPRLAELPTITAVGMNVLAPVATGGRLTMAGARGFAGFRAGEYAVDDPGSRARSMGMRATGEPALTLDLAEVCELDLDTLKRKVAQKKLVLVHSREIDQAGEAGVGLAAFEDLLGQVTAGWLRLKAANVARFVVTSDHGFLLLDETVAVRPYGKRSDPCPRYVLADERREEPATLTVSLAELGYQGRDGFLLFPEDTAVFDTGGARPGFVHGGNSPQERVIPVLTVSGAATRADLSAYLVEAERGPDVLGMRRLRLRLVHDAEQSAGLPFERSAPVDLVIRAVDRPDVRGVVADVNGPGVRKGGRLHVPVEDGWTEVVFTLTGPHEEQVRIEVAHPDDVERVTPALVEGWFVVEGAGGGGVAPPETGDDERPGWLDELPDDGTRRVFAHLARHRVVTEAEAVEMLGSARAFRRFSLHFEDLCGHTPLRVRIEVTPQGKRYVVAGGRG